MLHTGRAAQTQQRTSRGRKPQGRAALGRVLLLALGGASLLTGINAGLLRAELWAPIDAPTLPPAHGVLMVLGFLGTVIALERAQAYGRPWGYLAPAVIGLGGITLALGIAPQVAALLLVQGFVALCALYLALWRRSRHSLVAVQGLAAACATTAAFLWVRIPVDYLLVWLVAFVVLTIAAERAELAVLTMGAKAPGRLLALAVALTGGALASLLWPEAGFRVAGLALLILTGWLAYADVARRMINAEGMRRYGAAALLAGYVWLAVAGGIWLLAGVPATEGTYDASIHAVFLGFAMSMVMAHAPLILPAVLGRPLPYHPVLWLALVLLHGGLFVRMVGNAGPRDALWQAGSALSAISLLVFLVLAFFLVVTARASHTRPR